MSEQIVTPAAPAVAQATTAATAEEVGHKVFVGNLAFATKEEELKELFGKYGAISQAQIINRGTRSLGYGFVTYSNLDDATKAISSLDKSDVAGRVINVEMAKPPTSTPAGGIAKEAAAAAANGDTAEGVDGTGEVKAKRSKGARRGRGKGALRGRGRRGEPRSDGEIDDGHPKENGNGDGPAPALITDPSAVKTEEGEAAPAANGATKRPKKKKGIKAKAGEVINKIRGPPTGEPSTTLLFIANLPFAITDERLTELFTPYSVTSAHIVKRRYGPGGGRSKGFGFVEVADEANQKKAVEEMNGKLVDEREIQVKIAVGNAEPDATTAAPAAVEEPEAKIIAS